MSTEELTNKARELVTKLRNAETLIRNGKLEDGIKLFKEVTKEVRDAGLFDNYITIIRKIRRLIIETRARQLRRTAQETKSGDGKA